MKLLPSIANGESPVTHQSPICRSCASVRVRGRSVAFVERNALMPTPGRNAAFSHLYIVARLNLYPQLSIQHPCYRSCFGEITGFDGAKYAIVRAPPQCACLKMFLSSCSTAANATKHFGIVIQMLCTGIYIQNNYVKTSAYSFPWKCKHCHGKLD